MAYETQELEVVLIDPGFVETIHVDGILPPCFSGDGRSTVTFYEERLGEGRPIYVVRLRISMTPANLARMVVTALLAPGVRAMVNRFMN